jgi:hypothetical protein
MKGSDAVMAASVADNYILQDGEAIAVGFLLDAINDLTVR